MPKTLPVFLYAFLMSSAILSFLAVFDIFTTYRFSSFAPEGGPQSVYYDKSMEGTFRQLSGILPSNETIIISTLAPEFTFFTGHQTVIPYGLASQDSLVSYMTKENFSYLLVFENHTEVTALKNLFSYPGLNDLDINFQNITILHTDFFTLHFYRLKPNLSVSL